MTPHTKKLRTVTVNKKDAEKLYSYRKLRIYPERTNKRGRPYSEMENLAGAFHRILKEWEAMQD